MLLAQLGISPRPTAAEPAAIPMERAGLGLRKLRPTGAGSRN
jgi:hypothetical protein